jgi:hypothetical protein
VLGQQATLDQVEKALPDIGGGAALETFERTKIHLDENDIDPAVKLQMGAVLAFDPGREEFPNNPDANALLTRQYREPFVVPEPEKL